MKFAWPMPALPPFIGYASHKSLTLLADDNGYNASNNTNSRLPAGPAGGRAPTATGLLWLGPIAGPYTHSHALVVCFHTHRQ